MFATAGVKKTIALYDFDALISNPSVESHCPKKELRTLSKLSCLSWNKYGLSSTLHSWEAQALCLSHSTAWKVHLQFLFVCCCFH